MTGLKIKRSNRNQTGPRVSQTVNIQPSFPFARNVVKRAREKRFYAFTASTVIIITRKWCEKVTENASNYRFAARLPKLVHMNLNRSPERFNSRITSSNLRVAFYFSLVGFIKLFSFKSVKAFKLTKAWMSLYFNSSFYFFFIFYFFIDWFFKTA